MFLFPKPLKHAAVVESKKTLNSKVVEFVFKLTSPPEIAFLPGQFINLKVGETCFRSYSISSDAGIKDSISILAAVDHDGIGSNYLKNLSVGQEITFIGPSGRFILPELLAESLVFIATGTGIAPILSMLSSLSHSKCESAIKVYFGVKVCEEIFKKDILDKMASELPNFSYEICMSREQATEKNTKQGRVTNFIEIQRENTQYLICGHPDMVQDTLNMLVENGIPANNIFHEMFTVSIK